MAAIVLEYQLSANWKGHASDIDLQAADETVLRYQCFLGNVVFLVGESDFSARWGWVPILDFAMSLRAIAGGLVEGSNPTQTLEFTESDAELVFVREDSIVKLKANYVPATAQVAHVDLSVAAEHFLACVVRDLTHKYPALGENCFVTRLSRGLAVSS